MGDERFGVDFVRQGVAVGLAADLVRAGTVACQGHEVQRSRSGMDNGLTGAMENVSPVSVTTAPTGGSMEGTDPQVRAVGATVRSRVWTPDPPA